MSLATISSGSSIEGIYWIHKQNGSEWVLTAQSLVCSGFSNMSWLKIVYIWNLHTNSSFRNNEMNCFKWTWFYYPVYCLWTTEMNRKNARGYDGESFSFFAVGFSSGSFSSLLGEQEFTDYPTTSVKKASFGLMFSWSFNSIWKPANIRIKFNRILPTRMSAFHEPCSPFLFCYHLP